MPKNPHNILAAAFSICLATTIFYYFSKKKIPCSHAEESANKNKGENRNHWICLTLQNRGT